MRIGRWMAPVTALAVTTTLVACDDGTGPELPDEMVDDVALVAADAVLEDVALMTTPWAFGGASPSQVPGGHGMGGMGGAWSGTRSVTFYDVTGAVQDAYDDATTARIHFVMQMEHSVTRDAWSASVARSRDETVSGLEGQETTRTFDGTGTETIQRSRHLGDGTERSYAMEGSFTKTAVVVPVPGSESRWPLSGTIHRTMSVTVVGAPDGDHTRSLDITVTFDGDSTATAVVGDRTFEIDLAARAGRNPLRRMHGR